MSKINSETYLENIIYNGLLDLKYVGGKAHLLNMAQRLGINVAPGFVFTTKFYRTFIKSDSEFILGLDLTQKEINSDDEVYFEKHSLRLTNDAMKAITEQINNNIRNLHGEKFIVRSSANFEGLLDLSFSGIFSSYSNLSRNQLSIAVSNCYLSMFSRRALVYYKKYVTLFNERPNMLMNNLEMAVIIQELVDERISGNSIITWSNSNNGKILFEIHKGANHQLTSGSATGKSIEIDFTYLSNFLVINLTKHAREILLELNVWERNLQQLCNYFVILSKKLGWVSVVIEWGIDSQNKIVLFQVRPSR